MKMISIHLMNTDYNYVKANICNLKTSIDPADVRLRKKDMKIEREIKHSFYYIPSNSKDLVIIGFENEIKKGRRIIRDFLLRQNSLDHNQSLCFLCPTYLTNTINNFKIDYSTIINSKSVHFKIIEPNYIRKHLNLLLEGKWKDILFIKNLLFRCFVDFYSSPAFQNYNNSYLASLALTPNKKKSSIYDFLQYTYNQEHKLISKNLRKFFIEKNYLVKNWDYISEEIFLSEKYLPEKKAVSNNTNNTSSTSLNKKEDLTLTGNVGTSGSAINNLISSTGNLNAINNFNSVNTGNNNNSNNSNNNYYEKDDEPSNHLKHFLKTYDKDTALNYMLNIFPGDYQRFFNLSKVDLCDNLILYLEEANNSYNHYRKDHESEKNTTLVNPNMNNNVNSNTNSNNNNFSNTNFSFSNNKFSNTPLTYNNTNVYDELRSNNANDHSDIFGSEYEHNNYQILSNTSNLKINNKSNNGITSPNATKLIKSKSNDNISNNYFDNDLESEAQFSNYNNITLNLNESKTQEQAPSMPELLSSSKHELNNNLIQNSNLAVSYFNKILLNEADTRVIDSENTLLKKISFNNQKAKASNDAALNATNIASSSNNINNISNKLNIIPINSLEDAKKLLAYQGGFYYQLNYPESFNKQENQEPNEEGRISFNAARPQQSSNLALIREAILNKKEINPNGDGNSNINISKTSTIITNFADNIPINNNINSDLRKLYSSAMNNGNLNSQLPHQFTFSKSNSFILNNNNHTSKNNNSSNNLNNLENTNCNIVNNTFSASELNIGNINSIDISMDNTDINEGFLKNLTKNYASNFNHQLSNNVSNPNCENRLAADSKDLNFSNNSNTNILRQNYQILGSSSANITENLANQKNSAIINLANLNACDLENLKAGKDESSNSLKQNNSVNTNNTVSLANKNQICNRNNNNFNTLSNNDMMNILYNFSNINQMNINININSNFKDTNKAAGENDQILKNKDYELIKKVDPNSYLKIFNSAAALSKNLDVNDSESLLKRKLKNSDALNMNVGNSGSNNFNGNLLSCHSSSKNESLASQAMERRVSNFENNEKYGINNLNFLASNYKQKFESNFLGSSLIVDSRYALDSIINNNAAGNINSNNNLSITSNNVGRNYDKMPAHKLYSREKNDYNTSSSNFTSKNPARSTKQHNKIRSSKRRSSSSRSRNLASNSSSQNNRKYSHSSNSRSNSDNSLYANNNNATSDKNPSKKYRESFINNSNSNFNSSNYLYKRMKIKMRKRSRRNKDFDRARDNKDKVTKSSHNSVSDYHSDNSEMNNDNNINSNNNSNTNNINGNNINIKSRSNSNKSNGSAYERKHGGNITSGSHGAASSVKYGIKKSDKYMRERDRDKERERDRDQGCNNYNTKNQTSKVPKAGSSYANYNSNNKNSRQEEIDNFLTDINSGLNKNTSSIASGKYNSKYNTNSKRKRDSSSKSEGSKSRSNSKSFSHSSSRSNKYQKENPYSSNKGYTNSNHSNNHPVNSYDAKFPAANNNNMNYNSGNVNNFTSGLNSNNNSAVSNFYDKRKKAFTSNTYTGN